MRVRIQDQLCLLIAITSLLALMVLAVSTWVQSHHFVLSVRSTSLMLTANLKGASIAQDLSLYQELVQSVSTRTLVQEYLKEFNNGNHSQDLLDMISEDLVSALSGGGEDALLLQAKIFSRDNSTGSDENGLVNVTGNGAIGNVVLPYDYANGSSVYLGDLGMGYPRELYPNFTNPMDDNGVWKITYGNRTLYHNSSMVLGPLLLSSSNSSLMSVTVAINNNTSRTDVLAWLTVVVDARLLYEVAESREGLGQTGQLVLVGPTAKDNLFRENIAGRPASQNENISVVYVIPPASNSTLGNRHTRRASSTGDPSLPFLMGQYPSVLDAWSNVNNEVNNAGSHISTHDEEGKRVSTGYARVNSDVVDWVVVFEQSYGEVIHPIVQFRNIVLICVFSVVGAIILVCFPIAHCAAKPIKRLQKATLQSIATYEIDDTPSTDTLAKLDEEKFPDTTRDGYENDGREKSFSTSTALKPTQTNPLNLKRKRVFQIPERVPDKNHLVKDELTDLTSTFNEMSDELRTQYSRLEERVRARTIELEQSRNVARAASESKTLFIANISHELRTPLNGIIGMCTIAIQENSLKRVRQSLKIIYKSSDLLLHLLNDLITFSRNSYGQKLAIEDSYFRLSDIKTQLLSIFERQAKDSGVDLRVVYLSEESKQLPSDVLQRVTSPGDWRGPADTGAMKDMTLRGDKNRLLQILMNLVSNSLKFTAEKGVIELRIRCRGFASKDPQIQSSANEESPATTVNRRVSIQLPGIITENTSTSTADNKYLLFAFEVEDTGSGIPENLQKDIFKPFVQGDAALSKKHGGTGLGLAICAQLAALMGGKINLKSTVGIGSTFTLSIPLRFTKETASSMPASLAGSMHTTSKANSVLSSLRDDFTPEPRRKSSPGRRPMRSNRRTDSSEIPRVVGFSNPYIADGEAMYDEEPLERPRRASIPLNRVSSRDKDELQTPKGEVTQLLRTGDAEGTRYSPRRPASPVRRPGTPTKSASSGMLGQLKSSLATMQEKQAEAKVTKLKVLVAEDNKVNQEVIKRMLRLEKVTDVTVAEDGQEALEIIRKTMGIDAEKTAEEDPAGTQSPAPTTPFHVIFMDIQMPRMDDIQSTCGIRELGYDLPIVALTAFTDESNREACSNAGMQDFLGKPIKRPALKEILAKVWEGLNVDAVSSPEPSQDSLG